MVAGHLDLFIEQNADYIKKISYSNPNNTPIDLTSYFAKLTIRYSLPGGAFGFFTIDSNGPSLIIDGVLGTITISILRQVNSAFSWTAGSYDLIIQSPINIIDRLVEGKVSVIPGITKI